MFAVTSTRSCVAHASLFAITRMHSLPIQELALFSPVERCVEATDALLKRRGKGATYILPACLCALLREPYHQRELRQNIEFYQFCLTQWRPRTTIDRLLKLRCTAEQLWVMSVRDKVKHVCQRSLESSNGSR